MRQKSVHPESPSERIVKNIRRATRKPHSSEEKIRIVLDGLRGESSIAELCRREGQTQGKIERWHQTLKNRILLENYYLPGDLEANIEKFVDHYNHRRYHESLSNLTPANVYFGRGPTILLERERIKRNTIQKHRLQHQTKAA